MLRVFHRWATTFSCWFTSLSSQWRFMSIGGITGEALLTSFLSTWFWLYVFVHVWASDGRMPAYCTSLCPSDCWTPYLTQMFYKSAYNKLFNLFNFLMSAVDFYMVFFSGFTVGNYSSIPEGNTDFHHFFCPNIGGDADICSCWTRFVCCCRPWQLG